jgi:hypothetical protein
VVAIAFIEEVPSLGIFLLWYLATVADKRNQGYGSYFYHWILDKVKDDQLNLLLFEVEIPETAGESALASRRIDWYRRLGAKLIQGIKYMQYVNPDIPPKEMFLMTHQLSSADATAVFTNAKAYFGEQLEQRGELVLS